MGKIFWAVVKFLVVSFMGLIGLAFIGLQYHWNFITTFGFFILFMALLIATGRFDE
jgi:hypothetical protein